jgi:hypothetical protein
MRTRAREIALWAVVALLGLALYNDYGAVSPAARDLHSLALGSASAAEAIFAEQLGLVQSRAEDVGRDARDSMQTLKQHEVH